MNYPQGGVCCIEGRRLPGCLGDNWQQMSLEYNMMEGSELFFRFMVFVFFFSFFLNLCRGRNLSKPKRVPSFLVIA